MNNMAYHATHAPQPHGATSNDAPGQAATAAETRIIPPMQYAARLLNAQAKTDNPAIPASEPKNPNATTNEDNGTTATFAANPPTVKRENTHTAMGVPASQAANDTPTPPNTPPTTPTNTRTIRELFGSARVAFLEQCSAKTKANGDATQDVRRTHNTIPSITTNDNAHPTSNTNDGENA